MSWKKLSGVEAIALLKDPGKRRTGPHKMTGRILHWLYCRQCGTVNLKNEPSRAALRRACSWEE